jgi:hypothetical protein
MIASSVSFETSNGSLVRFNISDRLLTSADLLASQGVPEAPGRRRNGTEALVHALREFGLDQPSWTASLCRIGHA